MTTVTILKNRYTQILKETSALSSSIPTTRRLSTRDASVGKVILQSVEKLPIYGPSGNILRYEYARYVFPYAPTDISIEGLTDNYSELERPGRKALVRRETRGLRKVSFTAKIVDPTRPGTGGCEAEIRLLSSIASLNVNVVLIGLGVMASGVRFRITDMSSDTVRMNPQQRITIADVSLTFTEAVNVKQPVPGMTFLKDVPLSDVSPNVQSGTKTSSSTSSTSSNTEEIDKWTRAKASILGPYAPA
jgi:hypothetical protein